MKKIYFIALLLLITCTADAFRIPRPNRYSLPLTQDQINQINDDLDNIWQLSNGEFNLDEETTAKTQAENGDFWILATPITSKIQFRSEDTVFTVCNEGGDCGSGGAGVATTPGGSNPQLQYNNAGAFGGVTASGADSNGNVGLGTSVPTQQLELTKNLEMVDSTATEGIVYHGATTFLHSFGTNNLFLGDGAGNLTLSGATDNTIIGQGAGVGFTSGDSNTCMGGGSCAVLNNDYDLVAIGYNAMGAVADQNGSIAIGTSALYTGTGSGAYNIAIGPEAMETATTAAENIAIGSKTMESIDSGQANTAVGYNSMILITDAYYNTAIGANSAKTLRTGFDNTFLGYASGNAITIGSNNSCVGSVSCDSVTSGVSNSVLGFSAGETLTTGSGNTLLGYNAEPSAATVDVSVGIGTDVVAGIRGVVIGAEAGNTGSTADDSIFIGYQSGNAITTGDNNTCIGSGSCDVMTTGISNLAIGYNSMGVGDVTGVFNIGIGTSALEDLTSGESNTAIGRNALANNIDGGDNIAIGSLALRDNTSGFDNVAVGNSAGILVTTGEDNVFIGDGAGPAFTTGNRNTCVGSGGTCAGTNGNNNISLGYNNVFQTSMSRMVAIGNNVFVPNTQIIQFGNGTGVDHLDAIFTGQVSARGWSGVSNQESGIDFSTFSNSWTFSSGNNLWTSTTGSFFFDGGGDLMDLGVTTINVPKMPVTSSAMAYLCIDSSGKVFKKATACQ